MFTIDLNKMLIELVLAVIPVLGSWLTYLVHQAAKWIKNQSDLPVLDKYINILDRAVENTVKALMPLVRDMKKANKTGKLTPEQITEIQEKAMTMVYSQLSDKARKILRNIFRDMDYAISCQMEAKVYEVKLREQTYIHPTGIQNPL